MNQFVYTVIFILFTSCSLFAQGKVKFGLYGGAGYGISNTVKKTISPTNSFLSPSEYVSFGIGRTHGHYTDFDINHSLNFKSKGTYHFGFDIEVLLKNKLQLVVGLQLLNSTIEFEQDFSFSFEEESFVEDELILGSWNIPQAEFLIVSESDNNLYPNISFTTTFIELPLKLKLQSILPKVNIEGGFYVRYALLIDDLMHIERVNNYGNITEISNGRGFVLSTPSLND